MLLACKRANSFGAAFSTFAGAFVLAVFLSGGASSAATPLPPGGAHSAPQSVSQTPTPMASTPPFNDSATRCQPSAPHVYTISGLSLIPVGFLIFIVVFAMAGLRKDAQARGSKFFDNVGLSLLSPAVGADGRLSLSKLQFYIWTIVLVYCYSLLALFRLTVASAPQCILDTAMQLGSLNVPANVWIVLGLSSATLIGAKGITSAQMRSNLISKTRVEPRIRLSDLVWDDTSNSFSLSRLQMLVWTIVAVSIYVITAYLSIKGQNAIYQHLLSASPFPPVSTDFMNRLAAYPGLHFVQGLPDVDNTLLVLMGLSQATYIGNKLTISTPPAIYSLSASNVRPDATISINGNNFGNTSTTGQVLLNGTSLPSQQIVGWTDSQITFAVADWNEIVSTNGGEQPGSPISDTVPVSVSVASSGVRSNETMSLQVQRPKVVSVTPQPLPAGGSPLTINGGGFGTVQSAASKVFLNGAPVLNTTSWTDGQIVSAAVLSVAANAKMVVRMNGVDSIPFGIS
jgi:hypothetical protein